MKNNTYTPFICLVVLLFCMNSFAIPEFLIAGGAKNQDGATMAPCSDGFVLVWQGVDSTHYYRLHAGKISFAGELQYLPETGENASVPRIGANPIFVPVGTDKYFLQYYAHNQAWAQDGNPCRLGMVQWTGSDLSITSLIETRLISGYSNFNGGYASNGNTWVSSSTGATGRGGTETVLLTSMNTTGFTGVKSVSVLGPQVALAYGSGYYLAVHRGGVAVSSGKSNDDVNRLFAYRYSDALTRLDSTLIYDARPNTVAQPALAAGLDNFLLAYYEEDSVTGQTLLKARILSGTSSITTGNAIDITPTPPDNRVQISPVISYDEFTGNYLVVWQQGRPYQDELDADIYGARISGTGVLLDSTPLPICKAAGLQERPRLTWNNGVFLVTWNDLRNNKDFDIYGAILTPLTFGDTGKGYLTVTLEDSVTGQKTTPLATVTLLKGQQVIVTKSGNSGIMTLAADTGLDYTVSVSMPSYVTKAVSGIRLHGGQNTKLTVECARLPLARIAVIPDTLYLLPDSQKLMQVMGIHTDSTSLPLNGYLVPEWISRSTSLVTADASGTLTARAGAGSCFVVCQITSLGLKDSVLVKIISAYQDPLYHWKLDEVSGTSALDASGNGNTATLQGGPVRGSSRYGNGLIFDGVDDYLSTLRQVSAPNVFTLSFWMKTNAAQGGNIMGLGGNQTGNSSDMDRIIVMGADGKLTFWCYPNSYQAITSTTVYNNDVWHQVVATMSTQGMKLFVDTVLVASNSSVTSGQAYNAYWRMGADNAPFFKGQLDDIRVYDKALSASEIALLYSDSSTYGSTGTAIQIPTVSTAQLFPFSVSPNPFNADITIRLNHWKTGALLKILDIRGRLVKDLSQNVSHGSGAQARQFNWHAGNLPSGVYIVHFKSGVNEVKKRITLIR